MVNFPPLDNIPYVFKNPALLAKALTHPSISRFHKARFPKDSEFERLEFLGDRVLGLVIAQMVYKRYPKETEGDLAKRLAALVCREACLEIAAHLALKDYVKVSAGELSPASAVLADAVEALIGALYLDGGLEAACAFIYKYWLPLWEKDPKPPKDAKTELQECAQHKGSGIVPVYEILEHSGPAHTPTFRVRVSVEGVGKAMGVGASKRQAEQMAAKLLLEKFKGKV